MLAQAILPFILPAVGLATPASAAAIQVDPPLRIWLDQRARYFPGEEGRVEVQADRDGYLLVLQVDPAGNVRVVFPLDPGDDNFVRGGRKYELIGRGDRRTFYVESSTGTGTIYAAHSLSPFVFQDYVRNGHWDYQVLYLSSIGDVEGAATDLVSRMTSDGRFEYDVARYEVEEEVVYTAAAYPTYRIYDPYYGCFTCGRVYYRSGAAFHISFGYGDPWYYDPFYYYPTYPTYYGHYYHPYYPYYAFRRHWYGHQPHYPNPRHHYAGRPSRGDYQFKRWWDNAPGRPSDPYRPRGIGVDTRQVDYRVRPGAGTPSRNPVLTARPDRPVDRRQATPRGGVDGRRTTGDRPVLRPTDRGTDTGRRAEPARPAPTPRAQPPRSNGKPEGGRRAAPRRETGATPAPAPRNQPKPDADRSNAGRQDTPRRGTTARPAPRPPQRPEADRPSRRGATPERAAPRAKPRTSGRTRPAAGSWFNGGNADRTRVAPTPRRGGPVLRTPERGGRVTPARGSGWSTARPRVSRPSASKPSVGRATPSRQPSRGARRGSSGRRKP